MAGRIRDLTNRGAVLAAAKECDALGKDTFLERYGYRSATKYLLVIDGKQYDSKAIAGVAYGFQHSKRGQLKSSEFSGVITPGAAATRPKAMGFEIFEIA